MHCLLPLLLVLQPSTVIAVLYNDEVMLAVQTQRDVIYTAEFSRHALKPDSFIDGDRVAAEVRDGEMRVKRKDGKIVRGRVIWEQRVLVHPIPSNPDGSAPLK